MNEKRSKTIRRAVLRAFESAPTQFPVGYKVKGAGQLFSPRRVMYQRIKRLINVERLNRVQIEGMFR
jgi:hypothetical protein